MPRRRGPACELCTEASRAAQLRPRPGAPLRGAGLGSGRCPVAVRGLTEAVLSAPAVVFLWSLVVAAASVLSSLLRRSLMAPCWSRLISHLHVMSDGAGGAHPKYVGMPRRFGATSLARPSSLPGAAGAGKAAAPETRYKGALGQLLVQCMGCFPFQTSMSVFSWFSFFLENCYSLKVFSRLLTFLLPEI